jgi:hypothetical protein
MEAFRTKLDGSEAKTGACTFKSECWNSNVEVKNIEQGTRNIEQGVRNIEQGISRTVACGTQDTGNGCSILYIIY